MREPRADGTADHRASATAPAAVPARRGGRGGACAVPTLGTQPAVCTHQPPKTRPRKGVPRRAGPRPSAGRRWCHKTPTAPRGPSPPSTPPGNVEAAPQTPAQPRSASTRPRHRHSRPSGGAGGSLRARGLAAADAHPRTDRPGLQQPTHTRAPEPDPLAAMAARRWCRCGGRGRAQRRPAAGRGAAELDTTPPQHPATAPRLPARDPALCRCAPADPSSRLASRPRHQPRAHGGVLRPCGGLTRSAAGSQPLPRDCGGDQAALRPLIGRRSQTAATPRPHRREKSPAGHF